jgi:hypothetical protein
MIAYCGLDCSRCEGYLAAQSGDEKKIAEVARKWSAMYKADIKPENTVCDGCKADGRKSLYCQTLCEIRKCAVSRKLGTCVECGDFPCDAVQPVLNNAPAARENLERLRVS